MKKLLHKHNEAKGKYKISIVRLFLLICLLYNGSELILAKILALAQYF